MKVLEIISALNPVGGSETFAVNFCKIMQKSVQLKVIILRNDLNPILLERLKQSGADFVILDKQKHLDFKTIKQVKKIIKGFRPDVIHTENNALLTAYFASKRTPIFHTVHLLAQYEHGSSKMIDRLYKIIFKSRRVFPIGISDEVTKSITTYYHLSKKVPTIENGIDLDRFSKTTRLDQRHYDVTMVARFSEVKNHEFALTLFERIHSQCPNAQFALAGQGELLARCQSFAQSRNMDYLHFLGLVEDVPSLLNQSKVLMLCSHHEANPLSLLEGMASGCIIVASKVGGIPNIVKNGESGFLYDLSEPGEFQGKISEIINNPKTYEKMSDKNAENSKRFGLNLMSSHYIEFFSQHITTEK